MSAAFDAVMVRALEIAMDEYRHPFTENNDYEAITDLNLPTGTILENRGERVDEYLITAGVAPSTAGSPSICIKERSLKCSLIVRI